MRIGEILLGHGWLDEVTLARGVAEHAAAGQRLCSYLIARRLLDADHASRALGEQHGVAAVLQRHLQHRDPSLVPLVPGPLARAQLALPVGRLGSGELIVCVRDPRPALHAELVQAIGEPIVLAIAPASQLERLVERAYGRGATAGADLEFEVDLTTGPIALPPTEADPLARLESSLVGLDDSRVARDPTQSQSFTQQTGLSATNPPPFAEALAAATASRATPLVLPAIARAPTLHEALAELAAATHRDAATDLAMQFTAGRWRAALLFQLKDGAALGHRGHGPQLGRDAAQAVVLPLSMSSIVKVVHDTHRLATSAPVGPVQERLARLLGDPQMPAAAPVRIGPRIALVLAVGDPIDGDAAHGFDLEQLADALGAAYSRIVREKKE